MDDSIRKLIHLLDRLFELSQKQVDALDRRALGDLEKILRAKDDLLRALAHELAQISASGVSVMDAKTYPTVAARTRSLRDDLARELRSLRKRRQGTTTYSKPRPNGKRLMVTG
jgi:hypothetical protein